MNPELPKNTIAEASAAVIAAAEALKKHGEVARSISRASLVERKKNLEREIGNAALCCKAAEQYLAQMQGALNNVIDLIRCIDTTPLPVPPKTPESKPATPPPA
jgi:hypothetical protein